MSRQKRAASSRPRFGFICLLQGVSKNVYTLYPPVTILCYTAPARSISRCRVLLDLAQNTVIVTSQDLFLDANLFLAVRVHKLADFVASLVTAHDEMGCRVSIKAVGLCRMTG